MTANTFKPTKDEMIQAREAKSKLLAEKEKANTGFYDWAETPIKARPKAKVNATLKEIALLIRCKAEQNWDAMKTTKLYDVHSGEYCALLEILA